MQHHASHQCDKEPVKAHVTRLLNHSGFPTFTEIEDYDPDRDMFECVGEEEHEVGLIATCLVGDAFASAERVFATWLLDRGSYGVDQESLDALRTEFYCSRLPLARIMEVELLGIAPLLEASGLAVETDYSEGYPVLWCRYAR